MSIQLGATISLVGDSNRGLFLLQHCNIGAMAAFLEEAKKRFGNNGFVMQDYRGASPQDKEQARITFYTIFYGVVREYLCFNSAFKSHHSNNVTLYLDTLEHVANPKYAYNINNDFSCDYINTLIFSDSEMSAYEKTANFFDKAYQAMGGIVVGDDTHWHGPEVLCAMTDAPCSISYA